MKLLVNFLRDEAGATAIEYGLMVAVIAIGLLTTLQSFNGSVVTAYNGIAAAMLEAFGM
jgi:pilus assembly protein Flp/PilA